MQTLSGHTSPDTAYVVADYPYGFRLRCQMRHWIEYRAGYGFRHVTQTSNPKRLGTWNRPKAGTYVPVLVLEHDDEAAALDGDYVVATGLGTWATEEQIDAFEHKHAATLTDQHRAALRELRAVARASKRVTWTVTSAGDDAPRQSLADQAAIFGAVVAEELRKG